jgi:hypothetical protein
VYSGVLSVKPLLYILLKKLISLDGHIEVLVYGSTSEDTVLYG